MREALRLDLSLEVSRASASRERCFLYCDASLGDEVTLGGMLLFGDGRCFFFSHVLDRDSAPFEVNILTAELLAVAVSFAVFSDMLVGYSVLLFVDNIAAGYGLIKGDSRSAESGSVASHCVLWAKSRELVFFTSWISTIRNPADLPTRSDRSSLIKKVFPEIQEVAVSSDIIPWDSISAEFDLRVNSGLAPKYLAAKRRKLQPGCFPASRDKSME